MIGFIHPDGSGLTTRKIRVSIGYPFLGSPMKYRSEDLGEYVTWDASGGYLGTFIKVNYAFLAYPAPTSFYGFPVLISPKGKFFICLQQKNIPITNRLFRIIEEEKIMYMDHAKITLYDMASCREERVLFEIEEGEYIFDAALSTQGWLAVSLEKLTGPILNSVYEYKIKIYSPDRTLQATVDETVASALSWSRDGEWLAFLSGFSDDESPNMLVILRKDGSEMHEVTEACDYPAWSPDGKWIAFGRIDGYIYKMNLENGEEVRLVKGYYPAWRWDIP